MINKLRDQINQYFVGKKAVVDNVLICLLAKGHVLIEDVPGVGKTTLAKALALSMNTNYNRISFNPDTLPSDITGLSIYNMKTGEFEYKEGAIMANIVLADEINRTSPRTQSSLLEAMAENQVTIDGSTHKLPQPFMVIATQNPIEFLGTYPLPEAQMDRFMMKLTIGYPDEDNEILLAKNELSGKTADTIKPVCSLKDIENAREEVAKVTISDSIYKYVHDIVEHTRHENLFVIGASPRATIALAAASRARAYLEGRDYVKPDDVRAIAINVLHHRISLNTEAKINHENIDKVLQNNILTIKVPM